MTNAVGFALAEKLLAREFDLDGTLVDTAAEIAEAVNRTLVEFGLAPRPLDEITALLAHGVRLGCVTNM